MAWLYVQSTGQLFRPDGSLCGTGYAGHGSGVNNPSMQNVRNEGPLPCGRYAIGAAIDHPMLGPIAIPLAPDPANEMFGRSHFYMHGDNKKHDASLGCIIMARNVRQEVAASAGQGLKVIAKPAEQAIVT